MKTRMIPLDKIVVPEGLGEFEERFCALLMEARDRFGWTERIAIQAIPILWEDMEITERAKHDLG